MPNNPPIAPTPRSLARWILLALLALSLAACTPPALTEQPTALNLLIVADGKQQAVQVQPGTTVQAALEKAGITLNSLDRVDPPGFTLLSKPVPVKVVRVREDFEVKEIQIPYEHLTVRNESLPKDQPSRMIQTGSNGVQQLTYRHVFEDGVEVSNSIFKRVTLSEARPEIQMVGVQAPYTSFDIPGRLAYLTAGNAWVLQKSTGERKPVVTSGDLDGRIFSLSSDGGWLLYTRKAAEGAQDTINTLWAVNVTAEKPTPIDLRVKNVIHYAEWVPGTKLTITYSTVEPRVAPPGWQANNDLQLLQFNASGGVLRKKEILKTNAGGIYGWWGASFAWSPDGSKLAYVRPDGAGLVDQEKGDVRPLLEILPLQTRSDWAWVPGLSWSPDQKILYTVNHAIMAGMNTPEESPLFDVTALLVSGGPSIALAPQSGMFAYPAASPMQEGNRYWLAYLQAIFPEQSETSSYRLVLMDRDGSNRRVLYPDEDSSGLSPQQIAWSPAAFDGQHSWIALVSKGNLVLLDPMKGDDFQVTGDGSISRVDWK